MFSTLKQYVCHSKKTGGMLDTGEHSDFSLDCENHRGQLIGPSSVLAMEETTSWLMLSHVRNADSGKCTDTADKGCTHAIAMGLRLSPTGDPFS
jgi:hypothetical protein